VHFQKPKITCKPSSQAFFATRPAPSMTLGFDVFVQLVIAEMTTLPCLSSAGCPLNENFATLSCSSFGTAKPWKKQKAHNYRHKKQTNNKKKKHNQ
jgi:hypothetical protein